MALCPYFNAGMNKETVLIVAIIDRVGVVTYRIRLIGSSKKLVVHRNRLKLFYCDPQGKASKKQSTPAPQKWGSETACPNPTSPPPTPMSNLTYVKVVANQQETRSAGGYITSSDELSIRIERPQGNLQPPVHYGNDIIH